MRKITLSVLTGIASIFLSLQPSFLHAVPISFPEGTLLKDAQIDEILHLFSDPILQAAGLSPKTVHILLIATPVVNAASTIGGLIFVNTGLIMRCDTGEELAAVLAHEIGHLQKHHVITRLGAMADASKMGIGALGVAAIVSALTGNVGPLMMGALGAQHLAERSFLQFTRAQESEADQASFSLLQRLNWPVKGSVTFMQKLMEERGPLQDSRIVYNQTHPLHEERIRTAQQKIKPGTALPLALQKQFALMQIKVRAYSLPANQVLSDSVIHASPYSLYGQAIGLYRLGQLDTALQKLELFAQQEPSPYVDEFRAQLLFEKRDLQAAAHLIESAIQKAPRPHAALYTLAGQIKIAAADPRSLEEARLLLDKASHLDPDDPQVWRFLSIVYGKQRREGEMNLCLAESYFLLNDLSRAKQHVEQAQKKLPPQTPAHRRAVDLEAQINLTLKEENVYARFIRYMDSSSCPQRHD